MAELRLTISGIGADINSTLTLNAARTARLRDYLEDEYGLDINGNPVTPRNQAQRMLFNMRGELIQNIKGFERNRDSQIAIDAITDIPNT